MSILSNAGSWEHLLNDYDDHLSRVRGLMLETRQAYRHSAKRLLSWLQERHGERGLDQLTGCDVLEFVTEQVERPLGGSWRQHLCSETRIFLGYLHWQGIVPHNLSRVVPKVPRWRLSSVPRHLPWPQVRALIDSVDVSRPIGVRDKAVLATIALLGLRSQEVRALEIRHIAWRAGEIRLPRTKSRRERVLPLLSEVGALIADYLLHARPRLDVPHVFLHHWPTPGPFADRHTVSVIIGKHLQRAGIRAPRQGAYLLRHSLATRMVNSGVPIKHIADVLGHRCIDTTAIYTKVDTTSLAAVALPLPGGET